jgi:ABC-type multidrug transport system ATPase subunit
MLIQLHNAGKRFNRDWIFRKVNTSFSSGNAYAITGPNGSGKSTLLQVIAAALQANEGKIDWQSKTQNGLKTLDEEEVHSQIAICAPYLEVIEEMTATEFLKFHASFKPLLPQMGIPDIISIVGLQKAADKQIRFYSSGMKQRIKLAQAIFADVPGLLLDEPCTNLDTSGYELYHQLIENYCRHKLIVVSSNDINEYDFCTERISILDYKQAVKAK